MENGCTLDTIEYPAPDDAAAVKDAEEMLCEFEEDYRRMAE